MKTCVCKPLETQRAPRVRHILLALMVCFSLGLTAQSAFAQSTAFQLQQFRPWGDPQGMFQTHSGENLKQWGYMVGLYFNYAKDPLVARDASGARRAGIVEHQAGLDIMGAIGFLDWLEVGVVIPMTLYQVGKIPDSATFGTDRNRDISGFAFSDIKVQVKLQALKQEKHWLNLGFRVFLGIPSGDTSKFNGEGPMTFGLAAMASHWFAERVNVALNFGYRYLPSTAFADLIIQHEITYSLGLGVRIVKNYFDLIADLGGATALSEKTSPSTAPLDFYFGGRIYPLGRYDLAINLGFGMGAFYPGYGSPQVRVLFGVTWSPRDRDTDKDGILDRNDKCPTVPGPKENDGCPWGDKDNDGLTDNIDKCPDTPGPKENNGCPWGDKDKDGVLDNVDKCPDTPGPKENNGCPWGDKDKDGVLDNVDKCPNTPGPKENNGCPYGDRDKDGIPDNLDKCPDKPGLKKFDGCPDSDGDGIADKDDKCPFVPGVPERQGCPKKILVVVTKDSIKILQRIFFRTGSARIRKRSFEVLDQVVSVLKSRPKIRVRVEGHTDDVGSAKSNQGLSQRRAASVRTYLTQKGIGDSRLEAVGYGESRPLIPKKTRAARAKNRRVQFTILKGKLN